MHEIDILTKKMKDNPEFMDTFMWIDEYFKERDHKLSGEEILKVMEYILERITDERR